METRDEMPMLLRLLFGEAGGRLGVMQARDYVFAPLADPLKMDANNQAKSWQAGKYVSSSQLLGALKLYGRLAGIEKEKLTLMGLRRTAMRLRLEEEASPEEMQAFLDSQEEKRFTKYRLSKLPQLPPDEGQTENPEASESGVPSRKPRPFQPGEGMTHGMYASSLPVEAVAAVAAENIQGMEEEIVGLRRLARGLVERQERARKPQEAVQLGDAYGRAASRLAGMIKAERILADKGKPSQWAEEVLEMADRVANELGMEPVSESARAEALGGDPDLELTARRLVEEAASIRYVLRNTFRLAMEAEETGDYIRLVEIYGHGCLRLVRMLREEAVDSDRLVAYIQEAIDQAIEEVAKEMGLKVCPRPAGGEGEWAPTSPLLSIGHIYGEPFK